MSLLLLKLDLSTRLVWQKIEAEIFLPTRFKESPLNSKQQFKTEMNIDIALLIKVEISK